MLPKINKLNVFNISIIAALWLSIKKNKTVHDKYNQSFGGEKGGHGDMRDFPNWKNAILVGSLKLLVSLHKPNS